MLAKDSPTRGRAVDGSLICFSGLHIQEADGSCYVECVARGLIH